MDIPRFGREFFSSNVLASQIGGGRAGGKAEGLLRVHDALRARFPDGRARGMEVSIPRMVVVGTDVFGEFMGAAGLLEVARSDAPDERIAHAFQQADLPVSCLGDLRALVEEVRRPLAVRSSSLLEDELAHPFAGVYETKMLPNNDPDAGVRFRSLVEAVKLVYASTYFRAARSYRRAVGADEGRERMAVVVQEVVGSRFGDRFYPHVSGVCRSFSYYPTGNARPEDGVALLALGLGKTIVDGGVCWSYSPRFPTSPPPFASARAMMDDTQSGFWAVNMGKPPAYDPLAETEYLTRCGLAEAEYDGVLRYVASTYDPASDRVHPGTGRRGPRILDFAPLLRLREWPLNDVLEELVDMASEALGQPVEIEVACALPGPREEAARVGLVQVRPMAAPGTSVTVDEDELSREDLLLSSRRVMGNGVVDDVVDVVYTPPETFEARHTRAMAAELDQLNRALMDAGRPYLLVGFGRWGSSDPWLGVPVTWGQIAGARVIVEATSPAMRVDPSQGSHFFHNVSSLGILYFASGATEPVSPDWAWLAGQPALTETGFFRHVRLAAPLLVKVDGRSGRGFVARPGAGGRP